MTSDWDKITSEENPPYRTVYAYHQPSYQFAIAYHDWRYNNTFNEYDTALLRYKYWQMCELWARVGSSNIYGALIDFARQNSTFEVWYNGKILT
jgi:hypothetical protein